MSQEEITNTHEEAVVTEAHVEVDSHGAATSDESLAASLGLNGQLFAFQLLNFAVVAAILWFLILKPLSKVLEERKKVINESLDKAKQVDTNLQMSEQKYQEKLDIAKVEANKIIEKASEQADQLAGDMKQKAKGEIELLIEQAKKNINIEKDEVMAGVKKETANLIVAAVEKIMNEKLDDTKDKALIEDTLKKLEV
ncbi:F0F1 ATP synthase subunit B [Candidatus Falkowbacteria bacterium]|jgi:F-type H+-transporting ATPase subunit b|nr:F0F1 ATP synthase subunit B [Candidatus Falkowbacteria bacterium]